MKRRGEAESRNEVPRRSKEWNRKGEDLKALVIIGLTVLVVLEIIEDVRR